MKSPETKTFCFALMLACGLAASGARVCVAGAPASDFFDAHGVKIHYLVEGEGEPVVLIHGLYSSAQINWNLTGVMSELARDHRVIALDLPGHGRSGKPATEEAYGLRLAEDVIDLLDHLQIKKAHIVGYSLGGMVAVKILADHPDRTLSGTVGGMGWFREGSQLQKFWELIPPRQRGPVPQALLRSVGKLAVSRQELKGITVPVEILVGDQDPCKQLYVAPLRLVRSDWPIVEIGGAGHFVCIVKKQFRDEIARWLRKQRTP